MKAISACVVVILFVVFVVWKVRVSDVPVSVMEGDSVTLNTGVKTNQQDRIRWYFKGTALAQITGDQSKICTDVQCEETFRDRLKLDHQTGSLTITNITNTYTGEYKLEIIIIRGGVTSYKDFSVSVNGVSAAEQDEIKRKSVKRGESVTLDPAVTRNTNDSITWYYNDTCIAEITGDPSKICEDVRCKERFRDRLKLDHQTGFLTITNTRSTDSGDYKLKVSSIRFSIIRSFSVTVTGPSPGDMLYDMIAGICAVAVLLIGAGFIYCKCLAEKDEAQDEAQ